MTDVGTLKKPQLKKKNAYKQNYFKRLGSDIKKHKMVYLMALPVILYYLIFHYGPMYGAIIAFKDYNPADGIIGSSWVGLEHFREFFQSRNFIRVLRNTLSISVSNLVFGFPAPILLALLLNELTSKGFKKITQTITYLPHFISVVVVCGMIKVFTAENGIITQMCAVFGMENKTMLNNPELFVPIYIISGIWTTIGWNSIVYLAALTGVDQQLYEAAKIDGAGKFRQIISVTIPGIAPTIIVMLILQVGRMLNVGYEKIILLYNPLTYETADVISSYVYRRGLEDFAWSFSTAVGLFNSVINAVLIFTTNTLSKKFSGSSLW
ncbi:MAG: sugar ABC transporter permease [Clostridia bacterium]|nr:sugar ABC transporter permease [Clostridia bacterium]